MRERANCRGRQMDKAAGGDESLRHANEVAQLREQLRNAQRDSHVMSERVQEALKEAEHARAQLDQARPHCCPHPHRDWAHPCHIRTGTGLASATSAPGLGSRLPRLHLPGLHAGEARAR